MTKIHTRLATLKDCDAITSVHCSGITRWYKRINDEEVVDSYENLSLLDRYLVGGPWMSQETCAIHLNYMLVCGQFPLIAEVNGKVVGEIEVFIGEEPPPFRKNAHISVLEVAKDYRRRGIGKALVQAAIELAEKHDCNVISTIPEENAIEFYRKCGLNQKLIELKHIEIDLEEFSIPTDAKIEIRELNSFDILKQKNIVYGRYDNSYAQWLKRRWKFSIWPAWYVFEEGVISSFNAAYIIESHPLKKTTCRILAWIEDPQLSTQLLEACINRARKLGFKKVETTASTEIVNLIKRTPFSIIDSEIVLGKKLVSINTF